MVGFKGNQKEKHNILDHYCYYYYFYLLGVPKKTHPKSKANQDPPNKKPRPKTNTSQTRFNILATPRQTDSGFGSNNVVLQMRKYDTQKTK